MEIKELKYPERVEYALSVCSACEKEEAFLYQWLLAKKGQEFLYITHTVCALCIEVLYPDTYTKDEIEKIKNGDPVD